MGKELEEKKGLGELVYVTAWYDAKSLVTRRSDSPISKITDTFIETINKKRFYLTKLNKATQHEVQCYSPHLMMVEIFAYKISEFQIRAEIRKCFLEIMESRNVLIMKQINNFEDIFENQKNETTKH